MCPRFLVGARVHHTAVTVPFLRSDLRGKSPDSDSRDPRREIPGAVRLISGDSETARFPAPGPVLHGKDTQAPIHRDMRTDADRRVHAELVGCACVSGHVIAKTSAHPSTPPLRAHVQKPDCRWAAWAAVAGTTTMLPRRLSSGMSSVPGWRSERSSSALDNSTTDEGHRGAEGGTHTPNEARAREHLASLANCSTLDTCSVA